MSLGARRDPTPAQAGEDPDRAASRRRVAPLAAAESAVPEDIDTLDLEVRGIGSYQKKIVVNARITINEKEIRQQLLLHVKKHKLISVNVDKHNNKSSFTYVIEGTKEDINKLANKLFDKEWFESMRVE